MKNATGLITLALVLASAAGSANAGSKVRIGRTFPASQLVSMDNIEHDAWDKLLHKYVNQRGQVNYRSWKANRSDAALLEQYLQTLSRASFSTSASKEARLAFWINAYNAVTVRGILREYPTSSIRNHTARIYGYNIWKDLLLNVGGRNVSLNDMEHEILRKMGDPRIHFAIVCASHSCPRLLNEAYVSERVNQQLSHNTKAFFADPENFKYESRRNTFYLSTILKWFGEDFGRDQAQQLRTIAPYLPDAPSQQAARRGVARVAYLNYDWSLNEQ
jgi:hypothetical protein